MVKMISELVLRSLGQIGMFKELPRRRNITDADYESVVNKSFFIS